MLVDSNNLYMVMYAVPILFAITLHEAAHGWAAYKLGDPTAYILGRVSLNPLKHIDVMGTIVMPAILFYSSGFIFGWAKPVPFNPNNMQHPRSDSAIVAAAGPMANLLMALVWAAVAKLSITLNNNNTDIIWQCLYYTGYYGIYINVWLAIFNFIPIPPLDGSKVIAAILPKQIFAIYMKIERYGLLIILGIMLSGWLNALLKPILHYLIKVISNIFGL